MVAKMKGQGGCWLLVVMVMVGTAEAQWDVMTVVG
jgi:hypothetical protein